MLDLLSKSSEILRGRREKRETAYKSLIDRIATGDEKLRPAEVADAAETLGVVPWTLERDANLEEQRRELSATAATIPACRRALEEARGEKLSMINRFAEERFSQVERHRAEHAAVADRLSTAEAALTAAVHAEKMLAELNQPSPSKV